MDLGLHFFAGYVLVAPAASGDPVVIPGEIKPLARELARHYRGLLRPLTIQKPKGTRGFSFHWSNAQAAWDVIVAIDPTWVTDGAEFLVYFRPDARDMSMGPWTIRQMQHMAQKLPPHPGSTFAVGVGDARRVARRYLAMKGAR